MIQMRSIRDPTTLVAPGGGVVAEYLVYLCCDTLQHGFNF